MGDIQVFDNNTFTVTRPIYPDGSDRGWIGTMPKKELQRWCYLLCTPIVLYECVRTIPGEIRMLERIRKRKVIRPPEVMFFLLKYIALVTALLDAMVNFAGNKWMGYNGERCAPISWCVKFGYYICVCLVSGIVAFRCFVVFRGSRKVGWALLVGMLMVVASSMARAATDLTFDEMFLGSCSGSDDLYDNKVETYCFLATCVAFDLFVTAAGCYKLLKGSFQPFKMQRVTAMLFWNNVHYAAILLCMNVVQLVAYSGTEHIPSLSFLTAAFSIVIGLQQLIAEQDTVNGFKGYGVADWTLSRPVKKYPSSQAPSQSKGSSTVEGTPDSRA